jgi:nucleotidyltransferase substrate binding protein (TIGR01987 family)
LKDYLDYQGITGIVGSRDACREAFKRGLVAEGDVWMDMIRARNLSSHTYNQSTAQALLDNVVRQFFPAFQHLQQKFSELAP